MTNYKEKFKAIHKRFPDAKFTVSCFKTIDEIETKILNETDEMIMWIDYFYYNLTVGRAMDCFLVKRKEGCDKIYYKDVIDVLIQNNFVRNDCDDCFLETISEIRNKRNENSIKCYRSFWGS